jgi:hypothetical protein
MVYTKFKTCFCKDGEDILVSMKYINTVTGRATVGLHIGIQQNGACLSLYPSSSYLATLAVTGALDDPTAGLWGLMNWEHPGNYSGYRNT